MIIATYNANSLRMRIETVLGWLEKNEPDILCVQETKVQDEDFPAEAFESCGYEFVFKGQKKYNGVALFSRDVIADVSFGLDTAPHDEARVITAMIGDIAVVNTYIPQGMSRDSEKFTYKLDWFGRLREYIDQNFRSDEPVIWLGDMNIALDERDVYDPKGLLGSVCYCPEVWDAFKSVTEWGFEDVFRKQCDQGGHYTFWDYRAGALQKNRGWRLDYIMATKPLAEKCVRCWIDKGPRMTVKPSDHTFLAAEFDL